MSVKCVLIEQDKSTSSGWIALQKIEVTTPPTKTSYESGDSFDTTGMVVTGFYGTSPNAIFTSIPLTGYTVSPATLTIGTTSVIISYSESGKTFSATQAITVTAWEWGDETATADTTWWSKLYTKVQAGEIDSNWVGKTKSVTLTNEVLGTTTHLVRCIGVNQDGNNTVTFQTKNCLATTTTFDSSGNSAQWINSTTRSECINYYNAFPGKAYIKTVRKGVCTTPSFAIVTYYNETVWLPSIYEVGLSSYEYAPSGAEYTNGCSAAYSYYSSNANRKKSENDSSSTGVIWWTRSCSSNSITVCVISSDGSASILRCDKDGGLAPAFVIG